MTERAQPPCPHPDFTSFVDVGRIVADEHDGDETAPALAFAATIRVYCTACRQAMRVVDPGLPPGVLPGRVTVDVTGTEVRVPLWPADGSEPPKGVMAGFLIRQRFGPEQ